MRVTVLGANGMAGHVVVKYLKQQGHQVTAVTRAELDIKNTVQVSEFFDSLDTDFVVNCIGLLVKPCADRPDQAALVNSWLPHYIEHRLKHTQTRLIHLSTDCVFDGAKGNYVETDQHTETNIYGRSKSLGEVNNNKDITFRMSIIGPELKDGTGLLHWTVSQADSALPGWENAWWNGITTLELARCINLYINDPHISGVYHLVSNHNRINKYDLLCKINQVYQLGKTIVPTQGPKNINKVLVDTRQEFDFAIPNYDQQLQQLREFDVVSHVSPATTRT
jgi:dTDP-4-dehydrorhamnose reductase